MVKYDNKHYNINHIPHLPFEKNVRTVESFTLPLWVRKSKENEKEKILAENNSLGTRIDSAKSHYEKHFESADTKIAIKSNLQCKNDISENLKYKKHSFENRKKYAQRPTKKSNPTAKKDAHQKLSIRECITLESGEIAVVTALLLKKTASIEANAYVPENCLCYRSTFAKGEIGKVLYGSEILTNSIMNSPPLKKPELWGILFAALEIENSEESDGFTLRLKFPTKEILAAIKIQKFYRAQKNEKEVQNHP